MSENEDMHDVELDSPRVQQPPVHTGVQQARVGGVSYSDAFQQNNPNLTFETMDNPIWNSRDYVDLSEDNEPLEEEDPICPTILLTLQEKRMLREPWRNALILTTYEKGIGYMQLKLRGISKRSWHFEETFH